MFIPPINRPAQLALLSAALLNIAPAAEHVIVVSVDGLRPEAIETLGASGAPTFARLRCEGAATHNARTDHTSTSTVPNHSCMVTGRPVAGTAGHNYTSNREPAASATYHANKGSYVASVFDVAHDRGLKTGFYYCKTKLSIIPQSYSSNAGAADTTGPDNGLAKIDVSVQDTNDDLSTEAVSTFVADLATEQFEFAFIHLIDPDRAGHDSLWHTPGYLAAVAAVDGYMGEIIAAIEGTPGLAGTTTLIITADHGGEGKAHNAPDDAENYTIPFYVWGAGVAAGDDLYSLNPLTRTDPGEANVAYDQPAQPIRNADCANLALDLLGLPPISGSSINASQDLSVAPLPSDPAAFTCEPQRRGPDIWIDWPATLGATGYTVEIDSGTGWQSAPGTWPISETCWVDPNPSPATQLYRVKSNP